MKRQAPLKHAMRAGLGAALAVALLAMLYLTPGMRGGGLASVDRPSTGQLLAARSQLPLKAILGPLTMPDGSSAFPVYRALGAQVLELSLDWSEVAPSRPADAADPSDPAYRWPADIGTAVAQAARYGIRIALDVDRFPAWANGGRGPAWAPESPGDFASFLRAAALRYPSVRYWLILNEVNYYKNFQPLPPHSPLGPERYAVLLEAAYGALKAASAANFVIGGMNYSAGTILAPQFIRWMRLPDGAPPRMDYYGYNPYSLRFPSLTRTHVDSSSYEIDDIGRLHRQLESIYRPTGHTPKLWLSEFGISDSANLAFDYYVSPAVQARWVTAAFRLVDSVSYVAALGWYELLDEVSPPSDPLTEGLMTAIGKPKPSFYAYAAAP
jgi:hypothetical protein